MNIALVFKLIDKLKIAFLNGHYRCAAKIFERVEPYSHLKKIRKFTQL